MSSSSPVLNNEEIAERLSALAQLLSVKDENPYKVRAYRRAAATIRGLGESVDQVVRTHGDLTAYPGIGKAIAGVVRECQASSRSAACAPALIEPAERELQCLLCQAHLRRLIFESLASRQHR